MAPTRNSARQLVAHKHITVHGRIVNVPSYTLRIGEVVGVREKSKNLELIQGTIKTGRHKKYNWLEVNVEKLEGKYVEIPNRDQIPENIKEQLIVELYSK